MIKSKQLSADELGKIEDEWDDSTVVKNLLGHIRYLTDALISERGNAKKASGGGEG